jgi:hypothetical protein
MDGKAEGEAESPAGWPTGSLPIRCTPFNPGLVNSGRALCGLALILDLSVEIPVDYFPSAGDANRRKTSLQSRLTNPRSGTAIGGIAELAAFKLQWNCRYRNIDRARKWGRVVVVRAGSLYARLQIIALFPCFGVSL